MAAVKMLRIPADGSKPAERVEQEPSLEVFQKEVGGYIEAVRIPHVVMWVNEEGKLTGLPLNERASFLTHFFGIHETIAGDVVVVGHELPSDTYKDVPARFAELMESLPVMTKEEKRGA
jgi:hypothetical protein